MNMTRKPAIRVHITLIATLLCPAVSATSASVGLPASLAVTSPIPPVAVPLGSGFDGGGAGAGAAAAGAAGAGALSCDSTFPARANVRTSAHTATFVVHLVPIRMLGSLCGSS